MENKTANIKVDADVYDRFKDTLSGRFIGKTLSQLMLWYVEADQADRDAIVNKNASVYDKRIADLETNYAHLESRVCEAEAKFMSRNTQSDFEADNTDNQSGHAAKHGKSAG